MRMRFALVDAKIPNATVNTVATYTPFASTAYSLAFARVQQWRGILRRHRDGPKAMRRMRRMAACSGKP